MRLFKSVSLCFVWIHQRQSWLSTFCDVFFPACQSFNSVQDDQFEWHDSKNCHKYSGRNCEPRYDSSNFQLILLRAVEAIYYFLSVGMLLSLCWTSYLSRFVLQTAQILPDSCSLIGTLPIPEQSVTFETLIPYSVLYQKMNKKFCTVFTIISQSPKTVYFIMFTGQ
jgi:hypothetical protein